MNNLNPLPPCADYEFEIVELLEGSLAPEKARAVRAHLESCARCRAWRAAFAAVDTQLAAALPRPSISLDFADRLESRLAAETRRTPATELRSAADDEYRHMVEALQRGVRRNALLAVLALIVATAGVLVFAPALLTDASPLLASLTDQQRLTVCGALGGTIALAGLAWSAMQGVLPSPWSRA